jgi:hypothetical protein
VLRHDDKTMTGEPRHADCLIGDRATAKSADRAPRGTHLRANVTALPGDEAATDGKERKRKLDEFRQRADRAGRHGRPALAVAGFGGQLFGAGGSHSGPRRQAGDIDGGGQERRLLADRIDECHALDGKACSQRDPGKPAAAAEIDKTLDIAQQ